MYLFTLSDKLTFKRVAFLSLVELNWRITRNYCGQRPRERSIHSFRLQQKPNQFHLSTVFFIYLSKHLRKTFLLLTKHETLFGRTKEPRRNKSAWKIRNKTLINLGPSGRARLSPADYTFFNFVSASIDLFFRHTTAPNNDNEKVIKITFCVVSRTHRTLDRRPEKRIINVGNWLVSNNALFIMTRWFCQFRDGLEFTIRRRRSRSRGALAYLSVWRSTELWNLWHCFFTSVRSPIANHSLNHSNQIFFYFQFNFISLRT